MLQAHTLALKFAKQKYFQEIISCKGKKKHNSLTYFNSR